MENYDSIIRINELTINSMAYNCMTLIKDGLQKYYGVLNVENIL